MHPLPDDIRVAFEDRPGFLQATVTGPRDSHDISLAYWARIAEAVHDRGARKVLVIEALGDYEGERDLPTLIDQAIAMGLDRVQIAFVVERIELMAHMEHGEILAAERGANGRVFATVGPAERWLRHGGG